MDFLNLMGYFKTGEFALITRCVIDRIPIIVGGPDLNEVDDFVEGLCSLVPNRKELVFGTDFMTEDELELILEHESRDYDTPKTVIRAPASSNAHLMGKDFPMKGWIAGCHLENGDGGLFEEARRFKQEHGITLVIKLDGGKKKAILRGNPGKLDVTFETRIIKELSSETERRLVRTRRVLDKKIQGGKDINTSIVKGLTDLSQDEALIKKNRFVLEFLEFHLAARNGLALLSRLAFLRQYKPVVVSEKQFLESIQYDKVSIQRLLDFIEAEWDEVYEGMFDERKRAHIGDNIESLWG